MSSNNDEQQMNVVWQVTVKHPNDEEEYGGALCYKKDGHLLTAFHVVETPDMNVKLPDISVRSENYTGFRKAEYVGGIRSLDVAILRIIPKFDGEEFECLAPKDEIELQEGDTLVTHGHGARIPFSSRYGNVAHSYQTCGDLATRFSNLNLTLRDSAEEDLVRLRRDYSRPQPFRVVGNIVSLVKREGGGQALNYLHPHLPVIEQDDVGLPGFSGCPGFNKADGELVGMLIGGTNKYTLFVPNEVLNYVLQMFNMQ